MDKTALALLVVALASACTRSAPRPAVARPATAEPARDAASVNATPPPAEPAPSAWPPAPSAPPSPADALAAATIDRFALVIDMGAGPRVLLSTHPDLAWATGAARVVPNTPLHRVLAERAVRPDALPWGYRRAAGRRVRGYDDAGTVVCTARLGEPSLAAEAPDYCVARCVARARSAADAVFAAGSWNRLVASLTALEGNCASAHWVRAVDLPEPARVAAEPVAPAVSARVLRAFRAHPQWRLTQQFYARGVRAPERARHWDEHGGRAPAVVMYREPASGRRLVWASASVEPPEGLEMQPALTLRFALDAREAPSLLSSDDDVLRGESTPAFGMDLDGDGTTEWFSEGGDPDVDVDSPWHDAFGWRGGACFLCSP